MPCTLTLSVLSENQEGDIGNDWKYTLSAKVYSGALTGQGAVEVAKHTLTSGTTQTPPGPPAAAVIAAGDAGADLKIELRLAAAEVDLLHNDTGEKAVDIRLTNPAAGASALVEEREISVGVTEAPSGIGNAVLTLKIRLELANA